MNKYILVFISIFTFTDVFSQEDTTFILAHNNVDMDTYGNYDHLTYFPNSESYRKILMHFDLRCSSSGCSDWNYKTSISLLDSLNNNYNLATVFAPYGAYMNQQTEGFSNEWVQRYTFDVTDFAPLLKDSVLISAFYEGWIAGFNITLSFEMIHGTPARNVLDVKTLFSNELEDYANLEGIVFQL